MAPGLVARPGLVRRIDEGLERPLTLISAPAGSGKTALLDEWVRTGNAPGPVARLPLSEDRDRRAFWTDVMAAGGAAAPELTDLAVPPGGAYDGFLSTALNALSGLAAPLVLILDDLHVVRSAEVAADLDRLLDKPGGGVRLLVATRSDPPLRLERLRLGGRLAELRAADLAFTQSETSELLDSLDLSDEDVDLLWRRTAGWVGGLRMAQLSLEGHTDRHAFVMGFAGDDRAVSDYLLSEVVARQPQRTLDFLLRTCVVDRLNGDLADALTRRGDGEQMLRSLERAHGLASPIDANGRWCRYQPLLVEVLRAESRRQLRDEQPELHRVAGRWHAERGSGLEAVHHAVEAGDWELAAEVIGEQWLVFVARGGGSALRELAGRIPAALVRADAELALALAGLLLEAGDDAGADELLIEAHSRAPGLSPERARRFAVTSTATALYRARLRGDVEEAVSAASLVLDGHWERDLAVDVRALTLANLGVAEFWAGHSEAAADHLQQAAGLALECGNDFVLFLAESYAAAADGRDGRLTEASTRAWIAIHLAESHGWTQVAHTAIAYGALASVHLWRSELSEAERMAEQASAALTGSREPLLGPAVALLRAELLSLQGDPVTALDLLRGATAHGPLPPVLQVTAGVLEGELWLALGEPSRAHTRLTALDQHASDAALGLARLALAEGDSDGAMSAIESFQADERPSALPFRRVEAAVIEALALDALHDQAGALGALEHALDMAEPRGCSTVILRYAAPVRTLLRRLVARGTRHRALAAELHAVLDGPSSSARAVASPLLEPLSERELTVLRFLPTMMSNAEIAGEMFVSVNTVKTHLKHVYRKLDVADRRDCVKRARELRLLSPGIGGR